MPENAIIQQQRELLRTFREATTRRAKAEAEAEVRCKAERIVVARFCQAWTTTATSSAVLVQRAGYAGRHLSGDRSAHQCGC
jgi:hypothetical protein